MSKYRTEEIERLAGVFKGLGHPQRLRIFLKLVALCAPRGACGACDEGMSCCVGDLGGDLDLAPSTVSHHLKELRHAGLMRVGRSGRKVRCWIGDETVGLLAGFLGDATGTGARRGGKAIGSGGISCNKGKAIRKGRAAAATRIRRREQGRRASTRAAAAARRRGPAPGSGPGSRRS